MPNKMLERIMNVITLDLGDKKILNSFKRISLANIIYVLGKPIKNKIRMHYDVYKEICDPSFDNTQTSKVEEELYYLAETDQNMFGGKYEALKGSPKILHLKGNALRMFIARDKMTVKVLGICKTEIWHKDTNKIGAQCSQRMDNWKDADC
jgi:hypothetical protein